jgi:double-stranded uracil-DNA glycosylase
MNDTDRTDVIERLRKGRKDFTPWKPSKAQILGARHKLIPDLAAKNLIVLFVGVNPGLYTAAIGHHFGRPGNRFWPALHGGGFTPRLFSPFEESLLLDRR